MNDTFMTILAAAAMPFAGAFISWFMRWMSRQKNDPEHQLFVANMSGRVFIWLILMNLGQAVLYTIVAGPPNMLKMSLAGAVVGVLLYIGSWIETRFHNRNR